MSCRYEPTYEGNQTYLFGLMMAAVEQMGDGLRSDTDRVAFVATSIDMKPGYDQAAARSALEANADLQCRIKTGSGHTEASGWWIETGAYDNACGVGLAFYTLPERIMLHFAKPKTVAPEWSQAADALISRKVALLGSLRS